MPKSLQLGCQVRGELGEDGTAALETKKKTRNLIERHSQGEKLPRGRDRLL